MLACAEGAEAEVVVAVVGGVVVAVSSAEVIGVVVPTTAPVHAPRTLFNTVPLGELYQ